MQVLIINNIPDLTLRVSKDGHVSGYLDKYSVNVDITYDIAVAALKRALGARKAKRILEAGSFKRQGWHEMGNQYSAYGYFGPSNYHL